MRLRIEGDFTQLKINGQEQARGLARVPDFDNIIDLEVDDDTWQITSFKCDCMEIPQSRPVFLPKTPLLSGFKVKTDSALPPGLIKLVDASGATIGMIKLLGEDNVQNND